ncbi:MAG TPA: ATP synthase subunit I [Candidatus Bathyarchaeia archaeon]|nr:ATP synthase subunit I [Candidatus Bathyarchaeia archaeon]
MIADLAARVTWAGSVTVAALTITAWWLVSAHAALGVAGGGAVALVNFRWLARDVSRATALVADGQGGVGRLGRLGLRQVVTFGVLGLLIAKGWAHPVGVGVGLAALPPVLLAQGLRDARRNA